VVPEKADVMWWLAGEVVVVLESACLPVSQCSCVACSGPVDAVADAAYAAEAERWRDVVLEDWRAELAEVAGWTW